MKHEEIFERLDPPSGGIAKLRERLDAHARSARRARLAFVTVPAALAVAAAVALFVLTRARVPDLVTAARAHDDLDEVGLGLSSAPRGSVGLPSDRQGSDGALAVRTENPNVVFYWVASTQ